MIVAESFPIWPGGAPGAVGSADADTPTLQAYLPDTPSPSGIGMLVCPGGGYRALVAHEGLGYAEFLTANGIAAFVLSYRLGCNSYRHPSMLADAARGLRIIRSRAIEFHVNPDRIGVIGSSAGGHLAATLMTLFPSCTSQLNDAVDKANPRPDFGVLCYPVITMGEHTNVITRDMLLGPPPHDPDFLHLLSCDTQVTSETPPCFLWHTVEDELVDVENSLMFASALQQHRVPFEMHLYQKGHHGIGLGIGPPPVIDRLSQAHPWTRELLRWLDERY